MNLDYHIKNVNKFLTGNYPANHIEKMTGVSRVTISLLRRKKSKIQNVKVKTLKQVDDFLTKPEYRSVLKNLAIQALVSELKRGANNLLPTDIIPNIELLETPYGIEYLWVEPYNLGIDIISGHYIDEKPKTAKQKEERKE